LYKGEGVGLDWCCVGLDLKPLGSAVAAPRKARVAARVVEVNIVERGEVILSFLRQTRTLLKWRRGDEVMRKVNVDGEALTARMMPVFIHEGLILINS